MEGYFDKKFFNKKTYFSLGFLSILVWKKNIAFTHTHHIQISTPKRAAAGGQYMYREVQCRTSLSEIAAETHQMNDT